jgi:antitoxin component of MazEF toxin-antitoxin module
MTYTVKVYQSGNSKVITIPAGLNVEIGQEFKLSKKENKIIMEKITATETEQKLKKLHALTGDIKGWDPALDDVADLEEFIENRDE